MRKPLLIAFILAASICFGQKNDFTSQFSADSNGTNGFRAKSLVFDSAKNIYYINGLNIKGYRTDEIQNLLGKPNQHKDGTTKYFISNTDKKRSELLLDFENNKVAYIFFYPYKIKEKCDINIYDTHFDSLCQREFNSIKTDTILAECFKDYRLFCWKNLGTYYYEYMWCSYGKKGEKIGITTKIKEKGKAQLRNFFIRQLYKLPDIGIDKNDYIVDDASRDILICRIKTSCWRYPISTIQPKDPIGEWLLGK